MPKPSHRGFLVKTNGALSQPQGYILLTTTELHVQVKPKLQLYKIIQRILH